VGDARDKVIISCALTGAVTTKRHCPAIPYSADEIASEALRAYEAGAAIVHIHGRTDDGAPSWDAEVFRRYRAAIKARCPHVLINWATGGVGPIADRLAHLRVAPPDIAALNMGSMNYAKWRKDKKEFAFKFVFQNDFADIIACARAIGEVGAHPEMECFDTGHLASYEVLEDLSLLRAPYHFSFIMGVLGGIPATPRHLAFQASNVPARGRWKVIGISRDQWPLCQQACALGGDIRVGLEDNFYLPDGGMARSNGELVAEAANIVHASGRSVATAEEARALLGLPATGQG
jgi:3-keto-5-aminohexanoate cleavage enzyme